MGRSDAGQDACPSGETCAPGEGPEHTVTVSGFWLDRFEVTVERFRAFYELYPPNLPMVGGGAHPAITGSGWQEDFTLDLPAARADLLEQLACNEDATFSPSAGTRDAFPVNCVSWPLALLFCIESGGRLPTEAEWEYAAAGGDENRSYPWGNEAPDSSHASFFPSELEPTGQHPAGRGRFGQEDLAGGVWEWALDWLDTNWYSAGGADCTDCARVSSGTHRVIRGGAYGYDAIALRAAARSGDVPSSRQTSIGFRCAYDQPAE
jgi:formylglycine-generating enzyme